MKCKNYTKLISELLQRLTPSFVAFSYLLSTRREAKKKRKKKRSREEKAFSVIASLSHGTAKKEEREREEVKGKMMDCIMNFSVVIPTFSRV